MWTAVRLRRISCVKWLSLHRYSALLLLLLALLILSFLLTTPQCLYQFIVLGWFSKLESHDNSDVTVVTAYFNLGSFRKGAEVRYTSDTYFRWFAVFQYLQNPLLVFTDCDHFASHARELFMRRERLGKVKVIMINRTQLNTFAKYLPKFTAIFDDPTYPKFHPNTVMPEYACSQHAKIDLLEDAMQRDYFSTNYYTWLDLGYFRYTHSRAKKFWLVVPEDLQDDEVAMNEVRSPRFDLTPSDIFRQNNYWVGGGMVLATRLALSRYIQDYRNALEQFLMQGLADTDQQVIYSLLVDSRRLKPQAKIHTYQYPLSAITHSYECWFYLGYRCYREIDDG